MTVTILFFISARFGVEHPDEATKVSSVSFAEGSELPIHSAEDCNVIIDGGIHSLLFPFDLLSSFRFSVLRCALRNVLLKCLSCQASPSGCRHCLLCFAGLQ